MHDKVNATAAKDSSVMSKQSTSSESDVMQRQGLEGALSNNAIAVLQRMVGNRGTGQVLQAMQGLASRSVKSPSLGSDMTIQRAEKPNNTGLPDQLKSGIENLSGYSMDDVKVHYNSSKPKELDAHAYAQGNEIHLAPGQEQHLPHEAWHVVQQRQGRVKPTMQLKGVEVNDNEALEKEATELGQRALHLGAGAAQAITPATGSSPVSVAQLMVVRVRTKRGEVGRYISSVDIEGRVPTTARGGQGDHTVADFLPKAMLEEFLLNKTHLEASQSLGKFFDELDESTVARTQDEDRKMIDISIQEINIQLHNYHAMAENPETEGEDLNEALENILEGYIRLWNKRTGAAYSRDDGKTTGGGGGATEKAAKKRLIETGRAARETGGDMLTAQSAVPFLLNAIDFVTDPVTPETIMEASNHLSMALELYVKPYDELGVYGYEIMESLVESYAQRMGFSKEQYDRLYELCYEKYYGIDGNKPDILGGSWEEDDEKEAVADESAELEDQEQDMEIQDMEAQGIEQYHNVGNSTNGAEHEEDLEL